MLARLVAIVACLVVVIGLTGAFAAHGNNPGSLPESGVSSAAGVPMLLTPLALRWGKPSLAAVPPALVGLSGLPLLRALAGLATPPPRAIAATGETSASDVLADAAALGSALASLVGSPAAAEVATWWRGLGEEPRGRLTSALPAVLGSLQGMPFDVRDAANRAWLAASIAALEQSMPEGRVAGERQQQRLGMLRQVELALEDEGPGIHPSRSLVLLDTAWPGRAAVAVGDPGTADFVSYLVPGMFFTVDGQIVDWTETAAALHRDQTALLETLASLGGGPARTVATVAWMGYHTPDLFTVASLERAVEAADRLGETLAGLRAARPADDPFVSLLTHSYGSTAASILLARGTTQVDALAILGSPGVTVETVGGLAVPRGGVFVGSAASDPVAGMALHGFDPGAAAFGARQMGVSGGRDALTGAMLAPALGHNGYFTPGSESMHNLALISLGSGERVLGAGGSSVLLARGAERGRQAPTG